MKKIFIACFILSCFCVNAQKTKVKPLFNGKNLNGWYSFDDEGVPARPVQAVEHGILKTFLMSRSPIQGFPHSNGHGRRQTGAEVVSRQSNLLVESSKQVSDARLREMFAAIDGVLRENPSVGAYNQTI